MKTYSKLSLGRTKCRRKDKIKIDLKQKVSEIIDWIQVAQDMVQERKQLRVP